MSIFRSSADDVVRYKYTSMLFAGVIAVAVFMVCIFVSIIYNLDNIENKWSKEGRITVFPSENVEIAPLIDQISKMPNVDQVVHIDSDGALNLLKKRYPDQDIVFSSGVLPQLIEVKTKIKNVDAVKKEIYKLKEVEEVTVNTAWFDSLTNLTTAIISVAFIVASLVLLMSLLLISYVTKLGVLQRKPEISVMRLCGATEWFIRRPYVLSGLLLGFIGGGLGLLCYVVLDYLMQRLIGHFVDSWTTTTPVQMLVIFSLALLLGAMGNVIAFSRGEEDE